MVPFGRRLTRPAARAASTAAMATTALPPATAALPKVRTEVQQAAAARRILEIGK